MKIDTERLVREFLHSQNVPLHFVGRDSCPSQETESAGVAASCHQFRIGYPAHRGLNNGITTAQKCG